MLPPFEAAMFGLVIWPFLFYYIFNRWGLFFGAILSLILLSSIATLVAWIAMNKP